MFPAQFRGSDKVALGFTFELVRQLRMKRQLALTLESTGANCCATHRQFECIAQSDRRVARRDVHAPVAVIESQRGTGRPTSFRQKNMSIVPGPGVMRGEGGGVRMSHECCVNPTIEALAAGVGRDLPIAGGTSHQSWYRRTLPPSLRPPRRGQTAERE
jgi:hypothetical protein